MESDVVTSKVFEIFYPIALILMSIIAIGWCVLLIKVLGGF